jgi:type IV pilus assembly protein PilV
MHTTPLKQQRGATIFEILVSVLILSFGILALVGLQARSLSAASDAKYRVEATNYADAIIGQMWADRANLAQYPAFATPEAAAWRTQVMNGLPGATAPVITVNGTMVSVQVNWMPPGHPTGAPANNVVVQTRIDNP